MTDPGQLLVEASIFIEARPKTVFSILSDPERFSGWMRAQARFEPKIGSPVTLGFPQFQTTISGEVLELVPDQKISFSWGVSEGEQAEILPPGSTTVTFQLIPEGAGTRVALTHTGFPTEEEREKHEAGWRFHLSRLSVLANRTFLTAALKVLGQSYFGAWNEPDADVRGQLLTACVAEDLRYKDEYSSFEGRELLSLHIGNSQGYMPGTRLESDGEARICRGEVLIPWRIVSGDGQVVDRGTSHARVSAGGQIRSLTSFWGR